MRVIHFFILTHVFASVIPLVHLIAPTEPVSPDNRQQWPFVMEQIDLVEIPLNTREREFMQGFPGTVTKFTDGENEIMIRRVDRISRKLHPISDCLKGAGFTVSPQPIYQDHQRNLWGCVKAKRGVKNLKVRERILDGKGQNWTDVSSWFWSGLLGKTTGPWWAITISEAWGTAFEQNSCVILPQVN